MLLLAVVYLIDRQYFWKVTSQVTSCTLRVPGTLLRSGCSLIVTTFSGLNQSWEEARSISLSLTLKRKPGKHGLNPPHSVNLH